MTEGLPQSHRAHRASEQISILVRSYTDGPKIDPGLDHFGLTPMEGRIMENLVAANGKLRHQGSIYDAVYYDHIGDPPDLKIIDVYMCKIRKKLRGTWDIENVWGQGYRLKAINQSNSIRTAA